MAILADSSGLSKKEIFDWTTKISPPTQLEIEWIDKVDKLDLEIFLNRIRSIVNEGKEVMVSVGVTPGMTGTDLNCAVYTASGDIVLGAWGVWVHAFSGQGGIKYFLKYFKDSVGVKDGDLFYVTDPYLGGTHVNDQILTTPIFDGDELICWVVAGCHQSDVGAAEVGVPVSTTNRFEDGMNITTIKIGENLQIREDLLYAIANMTRDPRSWILDLKARYASIMVMRQEVKKEIIRRGGGFAAGAMRKIIVNSAEAARKKISRYNDGIYRSVVFADTIGYKDSLLRIMITAHKKGEKVTFDWTGTSPQTPGSFNSYTFSIAGGLASYLLPYLFHDLPPSLGVLSPFEHQTPEDCILDADLEKAVGLGVFLIFAATANFHILFSKMAFDSDDRNVVCGSQTWVVEVPAYVVKNQQGLTNSGFGTEINATGSGGRIIEDGVDAQNPIWAVMADSLEAEWFEKDLPFFYLFRKLAKDSCGYGKFRGGCSLEYSWAAHDCGGGHLGSIGFGHRVPTGMGLFGGYSTFMGPGIYIWDSNIEELIEKGEPLPKSVMEMVMERKIKGEYRIGPKTLTGRPLKEGDILTARMAGGGGYGDPLERDPKKVMEDVTEGRISEWAVANVYKVAADYQTSTVDLEESERMRKAEFEDRKRRGKDYTDFVKEWSKLKPRDEILEHFGPWT